ncbi:MAG: glycosyltransferase family 2 protein [Acidobacteriota bacterium]
MDEISKVSKIQPEISIVLPVYNESENIEALYTRLTDAVSALDLQNAGAEFLFVDDGSDDDSGDLISELNRKDPRVRLICLSRNFGHQAAITAGMELSRGDVVVLMDADLQDPPEVLGQMIEKWRAGADVVYAVRQKRKENAFRRFTYFSFYRLLQRIANIDIPLDSGDFCLMDRAVVDEMNRLPERNRFVRGLRSWVGFEQVALPYERHARHSGKAKYNFRKLLQLALNGIFSFSSFPLRLATYLGFLTVLLGLLALVVLVGAYFIAGHFPQGWTSLIVVVLFVGGVQLLILGAIGEYVALIHDEVKQRPNYVVRKIIG